MMKHFLFVKKLDGDNIMIIGLGGRAGSGKDTIGKILCDEYGYTRIAFGDYLKWHCKKYHNWNGEKDQEGRTLLQQQGTEVHRNVNENVWVEYAQLDIAMLEAEGFKNFVITDVRFPNEFDFVKSNNGIMVRVVGRKYNMGENEKHLSEIALDNHDFDYIIDNKGDMFELSYNVDSLIRYIEKSFGK